MIPVEDSVDSFVLQCNFVTFHRQVLLIRDEGFVAYGKV